MRKFDRTLFLAVVAIIIIGILTLYSATYKYHSRNIISRQVFWAAVGIILFFAATRIDYQRFISASYFLYGISLLLLFIVLFLTEARGGAHRWIDLGMLNLQPSELAKITLVLALSAYIGKRKNEITKFSLFIGVFFFVLPVFLLVLIEPDLGTALLFVPVTFIMLYVAGARLSHLAGIAIAGLSSLPLLWHFLKDYQKQRLFVFINPNIDPLGSGYTIIQSKIAIGSGGLFGKGWLSGTQNQLNFLPERHTDFIFSVIGEEWGFAGALILLLLFTFVIYKGIKIMEATPDIYGRLLAAGFISVFSLQVIINIGMTIGLLPIVGLTLPLISYGGSSLITTLVYLGLLVNIGTRRPLF